MFDISHMGQLFVDGEGAEGWLNRLLTNDVAALEDGRGHYTFLLNEQGGVIDDLILYRLEKDSYFLVVNAACLESDVAWLKAYEAEGVTLRDESPKIGAIAVQGPDSVALFQRVFNGRTLPSRNGVDVLKIDGRDLYICRTGYTGEDGFEFFCPQQDAVRWWSEFVEAGAKPCGLGSRDSLRLEKCYPLNGSDLTPEHTPLEAGLAFTVKLDKGTDFVGSEKLRHQKENKSEVRLAAILCEEKGAPPRPGYAVLDATGEPLGELTSGALSPSLGIGIGMAYLPREKAAVGTEVFIEARGRKTKAKIVKKPFVS
jgi:aminomethyltransferase